MAQFIVLYLFFTPWFRINTHSRCLFYDWMIVIANKLICHRTQRDWGSFSPHAMRIWRRIWQCKWSSPAFQFMGQSLFRHTSNRQPLRLQCKHLHEGSNGEQPTIRNGRSLQSVQTNAFSFTSEREREKKHNNPQTCTVKCKCTSETRKHTGCTIPHRAYQRSDTTIITS